MDADELMHYFGLLKGELLDAALAFIASRDLDDDFRAWLDERSGVADDGYVVTSEGFVIVP